MMKKHSIMFSLALILCITVFAIFFFIRIYGIHIPGFTDDRIITGKNSLNFSTLELNSATLEELNEIPGVSTALAKAIVSYRDKYGKYVDLDELMYVHGMSKELYDVIVQYVCLGGTP